MTDTTRRDYVLLVAVLLGYAVLRILLVPPEPLLTMGLGHDGAYLALVAKNIIEGKGFVLDALWLVFLHPGQLPMPYHNANPLYPLAVAGVTSLTGGDVVRAGLLISAVSSAGVIAAMFAILVRFAPSRRQALAVALAVASFPVVWDMSLFVLTDEFALMLLLASIAATLRSEESPFAVLAGALFGLAWLARSMTIVALPAILCWLLMQFGWRRAGSRIVLFGCTAMLAVLPWLIHNWRVWGDPLRSDNGYLLSIVAYYAQTYDEAVRAWHSPDVPVPLGRLLLLHPAQILRYWIADLIPSAKAVTAALTGPSWVKLGLLCSLVAGLIVQRPRTMVTREAIAFGVYGVAAFASMSAMGSMLEPRYVLLGYALFAAWLFSGVVRLIGRWHGEGRTALRNAALGLVMVFAVGSYLPSLVTRTVASRLPDSKGKVPLASASHTVEETVSFGAPVVVGFYPYTYSLITGNQALAIPQSSDAYLMQYMRQYHACCVMLSDTERDFWRPTWRDSTPPGLRLARRVDQYNVYVIDSASAELTR